MAANLALVVSGEIESCTADNSSCIFCKFTYHYGSDWSIISGIDDGVTQGARPDSDKVSKWNFPIEAIFQSAKPTGWPQILVAVYGRNNLGKETVVGYGAAHLPMQPGTHKFNIPLFARAPSSFTQRIKSWFTGSMPESISFNLIATGESREIIRTESNGFITVSFNVIMTGLNKLGLITV